jgi:hypothetical protein
MLRNVSEPLGLVIKFEAPFPFVHWKLTLTVRAFPHPLLHQHSISLQVYRLLNNTRHDCRSIELHSGQLLIYDKNSTSQVRLGRDDTVQQGSRFATGALLRGCENAVFSGQAETDVPDSNSLDVPADDRFCN